MYQSYYRDYNLLLLLITSRHSNHADQPLLAVRRRCRRRRSRRRRPGCRRPADDDVPRDRLGSVLAVPGQLLLLLAAGGGGGADCQLGLWLAGECVATAAT